MSQLRIAAVALIITLFSSAISAQSTAVRGGPVTAIVDYPGRAGQLYVSTNGGGVFSTSDGGATWQSASAGLNDLGVVDMVIDPRRPDILYLVTPSQLRKTVDGAHNWPLDQGQVWGNSRSITSLAMDGSTSAIHVGAGSYVYSFPFNDLDSFSVLADTGSLVNDIAGGPAIYVATEGGLLMGVGEDISRGFINKIPAALSTVDVDPLLSGTVYTSGPGKDGKDTRFFRVEGGKSTELPSLPGRVTAVTTSRSSNRVLYAAEGGQIYALQRDSALSVWTKVFQGAGSVTVLHETSTGTLYVGTSDSRVFRVPVQGTSASGAAWKSIGPSPPAVEAPIAVDPSSGTIYIAAYGGGVLKSTDAGATFAWANNGLGSLAISSMAMDPTDPDKLVVGTLGNGMYRTVDGGNNWTATSDASGVLTFVAVDALDSNIWYAGYMGGPTLRRSIDGGKTWVSSTSGIASTSVWSIVSDPNHSGVVYAATAGEGAFKSTNGGATWKPMPIQPMVWSLALDPTDSRTIYAGVNGDGIFKSTDSGETFSHVGSPTIGVVLSLVVDPTNRDRLFAATASGGVESSEDGGVTWSRTTIRTGIAIGLSVTADGDVFAGTAFDGAFVSRVMSAPPGRQPISNSDRQHRQRSFVAMASAELHAVFAQNIVNIVIDPLDSKHILLGTNDGGLLGSRDGGDSWIDSGKGFRSRASRPRVFDPTIKGRVYAGSFNGGGLFRSDDNGSTWTPHAVGSAAAYVWSAAVDPFSGTVYAGSTNGQGLWRSTDAGETFVRIDGKQMPQVRDIVFDSSTRDKLFVAALNGLFRSLDGGKTFAKIASGLINTISIDPTDANIIYAGTQGAGVLKSVDGGATFVPSNSGLATTFNMSRGNGVAIDPINPSVLYAGTEGAGVFKSLNAGSTWFAINDGLTNLTVFGLAIDRKDPNVLYAGGSSGVFKTITGAQ